MSKPKPGSIEHVRATAQRLGIKPEEVCVLPSILKECAWCAEQFSTADEASVLCPACAKIDAAAVTHGQQSPEENLTEALNLRTLNDDTEDGIEPPAGTPSDVIDSLKAALAETYVGPAEQAVIMYPPGSAVCDHCGSRRCLLAWKDVCITTGKRRVQG